MKRFDKKRNILEANLLAEQRYLSEIMGDDKVASDGGYYTSKETSMISREELNNFKEAGEKAYKSLMGKENDGFFAPINDYEKYIVRGLIKSGVKLEMDSEGTGRYYWIEDKRELDGLRQEIDSIIHSSYDKMEDNDLEKYFKSVIQVLIKLDSGEKCVNNAKTSIKIFRYIKSNFERGFSPEHTGGHIRDSWYGV